MEFEAKDVIALYLLEHPEDEEGVGTATFNGIEEQIIKMGMMVRLGLWGVKRGYFDEELVQQFIKQVETLNEEEA
jgi:hypothetical protein